MWSSRRKRISRKYDHRWHRMWLFWNCIQTETTKKLSRAIELSALYGVDKGTKMMREQENGMLIAVPDNVLIQMIIEPLNR